jgi:thiosulfate/3-mercaptopyruvate sulfurtransferase
MNPLVSPTWLAERLPKSDLVVLDATLPPVGVNPKVDTRDRYLQKHIPGAIFFDIEELSDHSTSLPHMLLPEGEFARKISAMGIGDDMTIVVYEQAGVFSAPRAWWMLRTFGAKEVFFLDGDLQSWIDADLPAESGEVRRNPANFTARLDRAAVKDFAQMQQLISDQAQILDARSKGRFDGTVPEPRAGLRSGHMPGAINVPFTELASNGRLKSAEDLRSLFASRDVDLREPLTTSCGSGITAAVLALGLEIAGASRVTLYDGSWAEYAQQPDAVIEKSPVLEP